MIFKLAKQNLLAKFEARFTINPQGDGYIFYPKEYEGGFACSKINYLKYTSDFQKFLKRGTWVLFLWLVLCIPLMIWLELSQGIEFNIFTAGMPFLIPFPFLLAKGARVFNAPDALMKNTKPAMKVRTQKQIQDARIRGMSWIMLNLVLFVPLVGIYVFLTDTSLEEWQRVLGLCSFTTISGVGIYLIIRKWRL